VGLESPWPNLFVVGAARAGTTSLWRYLGEHPDIFMTSFKEPHFFSRHRPEPFPAVHDENAYLRLFARARAPLRGEASPSYLWAEEAAERIKDVSPDAKIVVSLRDPVERAYSLYWHHRRTGREHRGFDDVVAAELELTRGEHSEYLRRARHAEHVRRYLRLFGPNVHVLVFEELVQDVRGQVAALFAFLGVDPGVAEGIQPEVHNPFVVPRGRFPARLMASSRARRIARAVVPYALRWPIERRLLRARPKPSIDAETDRLLTKVFAPDVRELATLLERPLPWRRWPAVLARRDLGRGVGDGEARRVHRRLSR
jgi:Sulfotransferase family